MDHKGSGGGTPFESMRHEDMLAWLDQANSGVVRGAADKLVAAAAEIHRIAEDLKIRPQYVQWKGEGADAFRVWSGDLANATLKLGDYSEGAGKWLAQASDAIAQAQVSIPRDALSAQANLDTAAANRNDPDAAAVGRKSVSELEALAAGKEAVRQEAAAQMRKLGQAYQLSAMQMDGLEKPSFPPPPKAIMPTGEGVYGRDLTSPGSRADGGAGAVAAGASGARVAGPEAQDRTASGKSGSGAVAPQPTVPPDRPVGMEIDGVATLPQAPSTPSAGPPGVPSTGRPDGGMQVPTGMAPPIAGGKTRPPAGPTAAGRSIAGGTAKPPVGPPAAGRPTATGRPVAGMRPPMLPGQGVAGGSPGRMPSNNGIVGGRPAPPPPSRTAGGTSRGTVVGGEGTQGRGPMGHGGAAGTGRGAGVGQRGGVAGRGLARESGGIVGGRPQQQPRPGARHFTPGGSGLVRGTGSGSTGPAGGPMGRPGTQPQPSRRDNNRRDERADYLAEDEETWQQGTRRPTPPVID